MRRNSSFCDKNHSSIKLSDKWPPLSIHIRCLRFRHCRDNHDLTYACIRAEEDRGNLRLSLKSQNKCAGPGYRRLFRLCLSEQCYGYGFRSLQLSYSLPAICSATENYLLYNTLGRNYLTYGFVRDTTTGIYDTTSRITVTYDAAGDPVMSLSEDRNPTTGAWTVYSRNTNIFNAAHYLLKRTTERWRSSGSVWDTNAQRVYAYNAQGFETKNVSRNWSTTTHLQISGDSVLTGYDASGTLEMSYSRYVYSSTVKKYVPSVRSIYVRSGTGQVDTSYRDVWDAAANAWKPDVKNISTYAAGKLIADTAYSWNTATSSWKLSGKSIHTYAASGKHLADTGYSWNAATASWKLSSLHTYTALTLGYTVTDYNWNATSNSFEPYFRSSNDTNSYGQVLQEFYEDYVPGIGWQTNFGSKNYYETYGTTSIASANASPPRLSLSPNPASGFITASIQWEAQQDFTITVVDMQGRVVQQIAGNSAKNSRTIIPVDALLAGTYILRVAGESGVSASKVFVVRH